MHGDAPLSHLTGVPGWETDDEQEALSALASEKNGQPILEIGGEFGMSTSIFAKFAGDSDIYSLDVRFSGDLAAHHMGNLQLSGVPTEKVTQIAGDSQLKGTVTKFTKTLGKRELGILFVDGDHSADGAYNDLKNYAPLVAIGGYVAVHDVANESNRSPHFMHFEVTRGLSRWLMTEGAHWKVVSTINTLVIFQRID